MKQEVISQEMNTTSIKDVRVNYPPASQEIVDMISTGCVLAKERIRTQSEVCWDVACTCGYQKTFRAVLSGLSESKRKEAINELQNQVNCAAESCSACRQDNVHQSVMVSGKRIDVTFPDEGKRYMLRRFFVTVEQTGLSDNSILLRYFESYFTMKKGKVVQDLEEKGRCFLNDKKAFFYLPYQDLDFDMEGNNTQPKWAEANIFRFRNTIIEHAEFTCVQKDEVQRIINAAPEGSLKKRVLTLWNCNTDGRRKEFLNRPGNLIAIMLNMWGPAISVLYRGNFKKIVDNIYLNCSSKRELSKMVNRYGETPAEVLNMPQNALDALLKAKAPEKVTVEDINNYKIAYQYLNPTPTDTKTVSFLAANDCINSAVSASEFGISMAKFAKYVKEVSIAYMRPASEIARDAVDILKADGNGTPKEMPDAGAYNMQKAVITIINNIEMNRTFWRKGTQDSMKYVNISQNVSTDETTWLIGDTDKKQESFQALMQNEEFVREAVLYMSGINAEQSISEDIKDGGGVVFVQLAKKNDSISKIICIFLQSKGVKTKVFEKAG